MLAITLDNKNIDISKKYLLTYLRSLCTKLNLHNLSLYQIVDNVMASTYNNINYYTFYEYVSKMCNELILLNYDYSILASAILVDNILHHRNRKNLLYTTEELYKDGTLEPLYYEFVKEHHIILQAMLIFNNDYLYDHRNMLQYIKMYSSKNTDGVPIESPQLTFMRIAINLFYKRSNKNLYDTFDKIEETYLTLSQKKYTHATPTIIGSGFKHMAMASCFMFEVQDEISEENTNGIFDVTKEIALNNKYMGGNGLYVGRIRSEGSRIKTINGGRASGIIPYIKGFSHTCHSVSQANRRPGVLAVFLDVWHPEIHKFCSLRLKGGDELSRARDLHIGVMIPDNFMNRLKNGEMYSLLDPNECPGLSDCYGEDFEKLYSEYEEKQMYREQISARDIFEDYIIPSMNETGEPYIMFRDNLNKKSMISHLCTSNHTNLCSECDLYSARDGTGTCILSSICLPSYIEIDEEGNKYFNFKELMRVVRIVTRNLNILIDDNAYPTQKARYASLNTRSIGIGVQGLADVFMIMRIAYDSNVALLLSTQISEAIQYAATDESAELAKLYGPYPWFWGKPGISPPKISPQSKGILQHDLWDCNNFTYISSELWQKLKAKIQKHGVRNCQVTAYMPTASTSIFMGFNESFEAINSNVYKKNNLTGENVICNRYLHKHLSELGIWNQDIIQKIIDNKGSIANIPEIPDDIKPIYKTIYELGNKPVINMCAKRGPFIDQSQSMNIYFDAPNNNKVFNCLMYAWSLGLKTGSYYTRVKVSNLTMKINTTCVSCQG